MRMIETAADRKGVVARRIREVVYELEDVLVEQVARRELLGSERNCTTRRADLDAYRNFRRAHRNDALRADCAVTQDQLVGSARREVRIELEHRRRVLHVRLKRIR